jgi:hypothetical protein
MVPYNASVAYPVMTLPEPDCGMPGRKFRQCILNLLILFGFVFILKCTSWQFHYPASLAGTALLFFQQMSNFFFISWL